MENASLINLMPERAKTERSLTVLFTFIPDEKLLPLRLCKAVWSWIDRTHGESLVPDSSEFETKIGTDGRAYKDLRFLQSNDAHPFAFRLARAVTEAASALRQDPLAFISAISDSSTISPEKRKRIRAGIIFAVVFYTLVLSGIYASYSIYHRVKPAAAPPAKHLEITYLAAPPMPVKKAAPQLKEAAGTTGKDQLAAPVKPTEQPKAESIEAKPTPRPPDQIATTQPTTTTTNSLTSETASRGSASDGAARGLTGNGVGTASTGGHGGASSADVNYNDVFSVSNVTSRPQILARPVPGYTEDARRAQVEGSVKLSVVLNANGTISDIRVTRGLGYGLDEKAIEAARELRFVPAQKDGHTVSVRVFLEFKFALL
ncbi:MAG TPA: TonB family protein [Blastocatellia bacterium]|nr:TonB family protein [Blastocatellia bacterium]